MVYTAQRQLNSQVGSLWCRLFSLHGECQSNSSYWVPSYFLPAPQQTWYQQPPYICHPNAVRTLPGADLKHFSFWKKRLMSFSPPNNSAILVNISFIISALGRPNTLYDHWKRHYSPVNNVYRPVARIFRRGVTWVYDVYVCMHEQSTNHMHTHARLEGFGGMLPQEILLEIRCSEIASEAILGQKQNRSAWLTINCIRFFAVHVHLLSLRSREGTTVGRTAGE